ncbi:MAG: hypothetical protein RIS47_1828 [Bacteroidota bacterium]
MKQNLLTIHTQSIRNYRQRFVWLCLLFFYGIGGLLQLSAQVDSTQYLMFKNYSDKDLAMALAVYRGGTNSIVSQRDIVEYGGVFFDCIDTTQFKGWQQIARNSNQLWLLDTNHPQWPLPKTWLSHEAPIWKFIAGNESKRQLWLAYENYFRNQGIDILFQSENANRYGYALTPTNAHPCTIGIQTTKLPSSYTAGVLFIADSLAKELPSADLLLIELLQPTDKVLIKKAIKTQKAAFVLRNNVSLWIRTLSEMLTDSTLTRNDIIKNILSIRTIKQIPKDQTQAFYKAKEAQLAVFEKSLSLLSEGKISLPLQLADTVWVLQDTPKTNPFIDGLKHYPFALGAISISEIHEPQKFRKTLVVPIYTNLSVSYIDFLQKLPADAPVVLVIFGEQSNAFQFSRKFTTVYVPENSDFLQGIAGQAVFGGRTISGQFPEALSNKYKIRAIHTELPRKSLAYALPDESHYDFSSLDSFIAYAISETAFPGCQIFAAYKGLVILNKSYGFQTYKKEIPVTNDLIYDIASLTKITSTTLATMKLYEQNKLSLQADYGKYFHLSAEITNALPKRNILSSKIIDLLTHTSGIQPGPPIGEIYFFKRTFDRYVSPHITHKTIPGMQAYSGNLAHGPIPPDDFFEPTDAFQLAWNYFFRTSPDSSTYAYPTGRNMYLRKRFREKFINKCFGKTVNKKKEYVYSDMNMVLLQILSDSLCKQSIDTFMYDKFYHPLGLRHTLFNPLTRFTPSEVAPTAYDTKWRNELLQGYVHDPTAAILGGISGNAGLFSNAQEIGVIGQMLLQKGEYGGSELIQPQIIELFTRRQNSSGRGLGFDIAQRGSVVARSAAPQSFGHTGFTGTCLWVDPVNEIVYVFVSNRICPDANNRTEMLLHVRSNSQEAIYKVLGLKKTP